MYGHVEPSKTGRGHTPRQVSPAATAVKSMTGSRIGRRETGWYQAAPGYLIQRRAVRGAGSSSNIGAAPLVHDPDIQRKAQYGGPTRMIQARLKVSQPGDAHEQEADSIAQKVMSIPETPAYTGRATGSIAASVTPVTQSALQTSRVEGGASAGVTAPPVIHDALSASGQPLDHATRSFMEPRFGRDFSDVRVHSDARAATAAGMVHARAFTSGRDIVFGAGEYSPGTTEGKSLLAHELVHVVQQGRAGRTAPENGIIQRKFLGGILGAIGGAIGGAILGGLVGGPIGAIVGGVMGAIGGAVIGDRITQRRRHLKDEEKTYAREIFRDTIDYSKIVITRDSIISVGAPKTIGNTIHLKSNRPWLHFIGDTMDLTDEGRVTLIHEMGHVWQYQNGGLAYIPKSLWAQFKAAVGSGSRNGAYDWEVAHKAGIPWAKWNPEQQASAIEKYNVLLRSSKSGTISLDDMKTLAILTKYMQKVWNREGAPRFR